MEALLAGIGIKDYIYGAIILAGVAGFAIWLHEHDNKVTAEALAPVTVLAHKAEVQVAVGTAVAQSTEKDNGKDYVSAVAAIVPGVAGLVCHSAAGSSEVPEAAASVAPGVDRQPPDSGSGQSFDPSGAVLERDHKADAQIVYLQGRVIELESQMNASP